MGGPREICLPLNIAFAPSTWVALSLSLAAHWPRGILILRGVAAFALLRPPSRSNRCCLLSSSSSSFSIFSSFVFFFLLLLFLFLFSFTLPTISLYMRDIGGSRRGFLWKETVPGKGERLSKMNRCYYR